MSWAAHTNFRTVGVGTSLLLTSPYVVGEPIDRYPPVGVDLPIHMVDGTVVKSKVVSSSPSEIIIELENGHRGRMTPLQEPKDFPTGIGGFPGTEWVVRERA
jgi:hypothetical protein